MAKVGVWLSYDLGVDGDYEALYEWLDSRQARECGDSVAFFTTPFSMDVAHAITTELKRRIKLRRRDRIYLIFPRKDGKYTGRFLIGSRKHAPWAGYAVATAGEEDASC